jgi:hypothetical protein
LWIGISNSLTIDSSSIPNPWLVSADAAITRNGNYFEIRVDHKNMAGKQIKVDVYSIAGNDTAKKYSSYFLVKSLPNPSFMIGEQLIGDTISRKALLKDKKI